MRIDAITSCVGEHYAQCLNTSLPIWLSTLDSLTVVTAPSCNTTRDVCDAHSSRGELRVVTTNVFTEHGAYFNKGAALCCAYAAAEPTDWALHFDADIIPPPSWRRVTEYDARVGYIHGVTRLLNGTERGDLDSVFWPLGYFQLWHVSDPASWRWPIFEPWHAHGGSYDANFLEQWPRDRWHKLPFIVEHIGEPRKNWFGIGNDDKMTQLRERGFHRYRMDCNKDPSTRLKIPKPLMQLHVLGDDAKWMLETMRLCSMGGPFNIYMHHGPKHNGRNCRRVRCGDLHTKLQTEIMKCLKL